MSLKLSKISFLVLSFFLFIFCIRSSFSQVSDKNLTFPNSSFQGVLQDIINSNSSYVTKDQYDRFWKEMGATTKEKKQMFIPEMKKGFVIMQEYQREVWKCAEESWIINAVAQCDKLKEKFKIIENIFNTTNNNVAITTLKTSSDNIIKSAAQHRSIKIGNSENEIQLSRETIRLIMISVDNSLSKFDQLLRVEYGK